MNVHPQTRRRLRHRGADGYVLLVLLLAVALMIMGMAVIVPSIAFEIKRDREEEMIHRGVQYSRAIRAYYKKFGRYPTRLEDLENTNNLRFLRKRYKDPVTGQDFKLLHFGDVKMSFGGGIAGIAPGVAGALGGTLPAGGLGGLSGSSGFGQAAALAGASAFGQSAALGGGFGASSNSPFSQNQAAFSQNQAANNPPEGTDSSQPSSQQTGSDQSGTGTTPGSNNPGAAAPPGQTFGGGPIVGVVSTSKKPTIREFNHKKKYNEWQFIYDPAADRGGLLMTPNQPPIQGFGQQPGTQSPNGQNNTSGLGNTFGTSPTGMQTNPNSFGPGTGTTNQPANPPEQ